MVKLKPVLNGRKQLIRGLLSSFCTTLKEDVVSIFEAFIPVSGELEFKIDFSISVAVNYSIRMNSTVDILGMMKNPFVTDLATLFLSLLKLSIKLTFKNRFLRESILPTTSI